MIFVSSFYFTLLWLGLCCSFSYGAIVIQFEAYHFNSYAVHNAPPPAPVRSSSGGSMLGSIGSTIAEGI